MLWCAACQLDYPEGKRFCKACGETLGEKPRAGQFCESCGAELASTARFCKHCGKATDRESAGVSEDQRATFVMTPPAPLNIHAAQPAAPAVASTSRSIAGAAVAPARVPVAMPGAEPAQEESPAEAHRLAHPEGSHRPEPILFARPAPEPRRGGTLLWLSLGILVALAGAAGWHFRAKIMALFGPPEPRVGWASVAQPDLPMFAEAAKNAKVLALLPSGQRVELLSVPEHGGTAGIWWARVRRPGEETGFVDVNRLSALAGETDKAQFAIVGLRLQPASSEFETLRSDLAALGDFVARFPSSDLMPKAQMGRCERMLNAARHLAEGSSGAELNLNKAMETSRQAAKVCAEAANSRAPGDRERAAQLGKEAEELAGVCDARLNPPPESGLWASGNSIYRGQGVTLSWNTRNAHRVTIEPSLGAVYASGSRDVHPAESTTYRLRAEGSRENRESTVTITVVAPPPRVFISAYPNQVERGQPVTLTWRSEHAENLSISPAPGNVGASGSTQVYPTESTNYRIYTRAEGGVAFDQASVSVSEPPQFVDLTIPAGTTFAIRMVDALDTSHAQPGHVFRATLDQPLHAAGRLILPKYAQVFGRVTEAVPSGRTSGVARLTIILYQAQASNTSYTLYTDPMTFQARSEKGKDAAKIAAGAAIGAIIGAIAGGGKGAAIGAGAGGAAGTGAALATKGKEIRIESETLLNFRLAQPITVRVQQ